MHLPKTRRVRTQPFTFKHGPCVESINGDRHAIEYLCNVVYSLTPGARETWGYAVGCPEEPPTATVHRVELLEATLYAFPSLQTGVVLNDSDGNWASFKRQTESFIEGKLADQFEHAVLCPLRTERQ